MSEQSVLIEGVFYKAGDKSFIEHLVYDDRVEEMQITPLYNGYTADWYQVIFESGDKRFIQLGIWAWRFLDQVAEPDEDGSPEADADMLLAGKVGQSIERIYHAQ